MPRRTRPSKGFVAEMRPLYIEEFLWKPREDVTDPGWEDHRNFWLATDGPGRRHLRQTAGINPIAAPGGKSRRPAVAIFVTPPGQGHRLPWLDEVDLETGLVRYFGDNKPELARQAELAPGNKTLLDEMNLYASAELVDREQAAPLLFFMNLGNVAGGVITQFLGFGVVRTAHRVTQLYKGRSFTNYAFDCVLFRGEEDVDGREMLDFSWIDSRRDRARSDADANAQAPASWRTWTRSGVASLENANVRRVILRGDFQTYEEQVPSEESRLGRVLKTIYDRYEGNYKHAFQALAALTAKLVIAGPGLDYHDGWVTPIGPDGGVDFVQRLDLGRGFSSTKLVVLGQAKCYKPWQGKGVSAAELARVVARLRRGWIGAYVTTAHFTEAAQREMATDEYPIVLIPGRRVAEVAEELRDTLGLGTIDALLEWLEGAYSRMVGASRSRPSDIIGEVPAAMASPQASRVEVGTVSQQEASRNTQASSRM